MMVIEILNSQIENLQVKIKSLKEEIAVNERNASLCNSLISIHEKTIAEINAAIDCLEKAVKNER